MPLEAAGGGAGGGLDTETGTLARVHELAAAIRCHRYRFSSEIGLQDGIALVLGDAAIAVQREVRLSFRDRIDFLAGDVGIEVKVKGSFSSVVAQLLRYTTHDRVAALILVTDRTQLSGMPAILGGKPLAVVNLLGGLR